MKTIDISDSKAREMISKDINTNLFVEASAGSGKTTSLVNRMVALVEAGVPVNQICTITFTVAAADEFFERFQRLLSRRTVDDPNDDSIKDLGPTTEISRQRCLEALNNIDSCFNGTMDSFCNMVVHELPNEFDVPSDSQVVPEDEYLRFVKEEYYRILTDFDHPLHSLAVSFSNTFDNSFDIFSSFINSVMGYRDYEIVYDTDLLSSSSDHLLDNDIKELITVIKTIPVIELETVANKSTQESVRTALNYINRLRHNWKNNIYPLRQILRLFKFTSDNDKKSFNKNIEGSELETKYLAKEKQSYYFCPEVIDIANRVNETIDEYCFQLCFSFVDQVRNEIANNMKKKGMFTFFDFLFYLTEKFKENSATVNREIISHVYQRHSRILIDESQDTNPMQTQLFFYLTGLTSTDKWELVEPQPGSLFIVGDPKQSIYAFRGADVKAYNYTKEVFGDFGKVLTLTKNFRSNVEVKQYFNDVMNDVLNVGEDSLTHLDIPLIPENEKEKERVNAEKDKDITLNGVYRYQTSKSRDIDARNVADIVNQIVENDNYQIISKKSNKVRRIEYRDILIITPNKKIEEYVAEFASRNIPLRVEAKIFFSNSASVDILKKLTYLLFEPYQIRYFIDIVTSSLYKLNTADISLMKQDGFSLNIAEYDESINFSNERHKEIVKALNELYVRTRGLSVSSTLFYLLSNKDYEFFKNIDPNFIDYAYFMVELVKKAEQDGTIISFNDAKKFLETTISDSSDVEKIMKFSNDVNQVKISNLHKVKGLQAPVVILAMPDAERHDAFMYADSDEKKLYFSKISVSNAYGGSILLGQSKKYDDKIAKADLALEAERRRVEYVAATRAEAVLIIANTVDKLGSTRYRPWAHLYRDDLKDLPNFESNQKTLKEETYTEAMEGYHSIVNENCHNPSFSLKNPSGLRFKSHITNVDEVIEKEDLGVEGNVLGSLIHRLLECIVNSKNKYVLPELVGKIFEEYDIDTTKVNLFTSLVDIGNRFVTTGFRQSKNVVPDHLFEVLMKSEKVMCEVPFSYRSDNNVISGIIDLIYKDESGWHIIDYKTNYEGDIDNLEEEYQIQLSTYVKAFRQATGFNCDAHIYHIDK